jgi:hypothetical protein
VANQYFYCSQCQKRSATHLKLFDVLYNFSKMSAEACPVCGATRELHVNLDFQLGAGDGDFKVVSAILPDKLESCLAKRKKRSRSILF